MRLSKIASLVVAISALACAWSPVLATPVPGKQPVAMVPMRDGVRLATDVYLPPDQSPPYPVLYSAGPYGRPPGRGFAQDLMKRGYAVVIQDMRGRGTSEGEDEIIFHHNGWAKNRDGHDTIEWIARQPWCNGKIGTFGGSAGGITQNMTAPLAPAALKAQFIEVAFSDMYSQCVFQGGVWRKELIEGWLIANKIVEGNMPAFIAHPSRDDFWEELAPESQAKNINVPQTHLGGWYDIFLQGTINGFLAAQEQGGPAAKGNCRLIVGPWAHGPFDQLQYPNANFTAVKAADRLRFFDYWLKGEPNGADADKPVHYYLMGDPTDPTAPGNEWRSSDRWPPAATATPYYFHAEGVLSSSPPSSRGAQQTYRYDPAHPVPTVGGQNLIIPRGPMDQRAIEDRQDVLLFTSEVLAEPLEITGPIFSKIYVSSDCPDTDFTVKLTDVYPDGRSMLITDGILQARHHRSLAREDFLTPGQVYELTVDLWSTAIIINKGHRLRVAVSSSNSPRFEPNPNTGKSFRADSGTRIATNTLHLSTAYPSALVLPIRATADPGISVNAEGEEN